MTVFRDIMATAKGLIIKMSIKLDRCNRFATIVPDKYSYGGGAGYWLLKIEPSFAKEDAVHD